jgi:hypothetical protein
MPVGFCAEIIPEGIIVLKYGVSRDQVLLESTPKERGAGNGIRTRIFSLEGCNSPLELYLLV